VGTVDSPDRRNGICASSPLNVLGVSGLYHDSAACLVRDGNIVAAAQEERFSRKKHDARMPRNAIGWCLEAGSVKPGDLDIAVFYDKPVTKFARLLATYAQVAPRGLRSFMMGVPAWLRDKAWVGFQLEQALRDAGHPRPKRMLFTEHHVSHAASAFYPSPFAEAAVVTVDGVGEWCTAGIFVGEGHELRMLFEQRFPHSIGMLYSAFTYFTGFRVNSGEYKLMGLAPYGEPRYADLIRKHLIDIREDGSFRLNLEYFGFLDELTMTNDSFARLFGGAPRQPESPITEREMDLAASIQQVTDQIMLKIVRYARAVTGKPNLCLAGGVALNCVANGKILRSGIFDDVWIQPAGGDAGGALGAALYVWHQVLGHARNPNPSDSMHGALLGPGFAPALTREFLDKNALPYRQMMRSQRNAYVARALAEEKVVGVLQGRTEFGPRALGNRSILADARSVKMQSHINIATKFREGFRPFAPIVLAEDAPEYFEVVKSSPYMLLVDRVRPERWIHDSQGRRDIVSWVNTPRSDIPAVTHVDYSARIQTADPARHPDVHGILTEFKKLTGYGILVNTSFNVRSEPIVCTPEDAYRCFMRTGIDILVLDDFVLEKADQPPCIDMKDWRMEFGLD
jgi:carbamoyltransferase